MQVKSASHAKGLGKKIDRTKGGSDATASLSDELLSRILRLLPSNPYPCSLVCKRWLKLHGFLRHSIKLSEWSFLENGRMIGRFPNLTDVDLTSACVIPPKNSAVIFTHHFLTIQLGLDAFDSRSIECFIQEQLLSPSTLDKGLKILAEGCPNLQRLCVVDVRRATYNQSSFRKKERFNHENFKSLQNFSPVNGIVNCMDAGKDSKDKISLSEDAKEEIQVLDLSHPCTEGKKNDVSKLQKSLESLHLSDSEQGLAAIAKKCPTLQELEIRQCTDESLSAISTCKNLQILRLVGTINGFYHCTFTDVGLTVLARSCSRLVRLELSGCEASYDGIAAIGKCCVMLEELTISNQGFYEGWIAALFFCRCLKTLRLESCKQIDPFPGPLEYLGHCEAVERLQLVRCDLRDRVGFNALMLVVCTTLKQIEFQDCWGLDDANFIVASYCRRIRLLSLEGCSLLTTLGLEKVLLSWKDLTVLHVVYCNNIKDSEISVELALLFSNLKELKWRPDTKSFLAISLAGTGVGQKGGKFFRKG